MNKTVIMLWFIVALIVMATLAAWATYRAYQYGAGKILVSETEEFLKGEN